MTIFDYFRDKGIDTTDASFYRKIEEWKSWYVSNVRNFSTYKVYMGQGSYVRRKRKTMGMAKVVCEDMANLLLNERVKFVLSDEHTQEFVDDVLDSTNFWTIANEYQERKAATGTVAFVPYLKNVEVDEEGNVIPLTGSIGIDFVSASCIYPTAWENGKITECIFAFPKTIARRKYIQLAWHKLNHDGLYVIENSVVECASGGGGWKDLTPTEWKQLKPFETLAVLIETGSAEPQFVIDKLNLVNNADEDETNPMGVALFANAVDILKKIDIEYDSYANEFELGRKRIFVAPEILKNNDGTLAFDPDDSVFYMLPDDYAEKDKNGMIHEVDLSLRIDQHSKAINDDINYLSIKCGLGKDHYRFEAGQVRTATEIVSENSDLFRTLKKHEILLDAAMKELVRIIIRLGNRIGYGLDELVEIAIDFDDSIIEDKVAERTADRADVAMGAMPLYEYRMKWYQEDEETAKEKIDMMENKDVIL